MIALGFDPDFPDTLEKADNGRPGKCVMARRKRYFWEFKCEALEMTLVPGVALKQVGEELGIS